MHARFFSFLFVALTLASPFSAARADQAADEQAIRDNCNKYVELYNRRDSKSMAEMWSPDAVYQDPSTGEGVVGREAIAKTLDEVFAGSEDAKLAVNIDSIEFMSPNVAIEKGTAEITYGKGEPEHTQYSAVHVKRDGKWLLDRVSEELQPEPPPSHYEQLKELEWMVGSWIDDNGGVLIQTDCQWTKNKNFLTRSFAVMIGDQVDMSGMQVVGWDPAAKQIRSWVFDSDGTFGEGTWSRKDNTWSIKQTGVLPDGKKTTATNIITKVDDNTLTWQSVDRTIDGELQPNIEEVVVVRQPSELDIAVVVENNAGYSEAESPDTSDAGAAPAATEAKAEAAELSGSASPDQKSKK